MLDSWYGIPELGGHSTVASASPLDTAKTTKCRQSTTEWVRIVVFSRRIISYRHHELQPSAHDAEARAISRRLSFLSIHTVVEYFPLLRH